LTTEKGSGRLLWNQPSVVGICSVALLVTAAIIAFQNLLRSGDIGRGPTPIFYALFLFQDYVGSFLYVGVLLVGLVPAVQRPATAIAHRLGSHPALVATAVCLCLAAGSFWVYQAHPLAMDESTPYMQAQVFASGALLGQLPPELLDWLVFPPFQNYFIQVSHQTGQIASAYWPGFALLLTPFMALGIPWLCNPVLGGLAVWTIHRLTLQLTESTEAAGAAVLFTLASAAFVVNSISFYSMTAHLLCNAVFALLLLRPTVPRAAAAGLIGGLALTLHNPVPHMLFAVPWLMWLAFQPDRRRLIPAIAAGYLPWVMIVGFGWHRLLQGLGEGTTSAAAANGGNPFAVAISSLAGVFKVPGATQLTDRLIGLAKLWIWAAPLLLLVACAGFWRFRRDTRFRLLLASAVLTFVGYLFVPLSQGHGWGFRYFHSAWFVLPILAASVVTGGSGKAAGDARPARGPLGRYALATALGGLLVMTPFFLWQVHSFIQEHLAQVPAAERGRPRVVIIDPYMGYYAQDLAQNDPFLRAPVIRMITQGRDNDMAMMARYFPDLVLLSKSFRGTVWGYAYDASAESAAAGGSNRSRPEEGHQAGAGGVDEKSRRD
jgi:hypothetical protein